MKVYYGIDPGLSGGIARILVRDGAQPDVTVMDMPTVTIAKNGSRRREYLAADMAHMFTLKTFPSLVPGESCVVHVRTMAVLEHVHAMPGNGSIGNFGMGMGLGLWIGILASLGIPYTLVPAPTWKKFLGCNKDKQGSILRAQQLYPQVADQLKRKKDDGRAEAILLAHYAMTVFG